MLASVYIKDGNIHFYNENNIFSNIGGIAYELGRPLLDFVCYEQDRFDDGFSITASAFDNDFAHLGANDPEFIASIKEAGDKFQQHEIYVFFYRSMLFEFIYAFIESPRKAIERLAEQIPGVKEKLAWTIDFEWPASSSPLVQVAQYADRERRLYRAAMDVVTLMSDNLRMAREAMIVEIELLLMLRKEVPGLRPMDYLYALEQTHKEHTGHFYYLENPFKAFYGAVGGGEIAELYEINTIKDLLRFEFIKMIESDIFIKKCKNCERFFIPKRRADAEYCDRIYGDGPRRCSEIGAMLRYERKIAENPILEAHKRAYRRFNSRVRMKKMTQDEFRLWSDEASKKRDECLAGSLSFEDFTAWLEQGRVRKRRRSEQ